MRTKSIFLLLATVVSLLSCKDEYPDLNDGLYAEFNTSMGPIVAELYYKETPMAAANFVSLAEGTSEMVDSTYKGKKFYDGLIFHRVMDGFVIQGGDPTGTGRGGPGYRFPDEFSDSLSHDAKGVLSMANSGPGTNGSQFFITLAPAPYLDGVHTIFGKVVKGLDVVDSIGKVETGPGDRPKEDITIKEVNIIRKGKDAKDFDAPKVFKQSLEKVEEEKAAREKEQKARRDKKAGELKDLEAKADSLDSGLKIYFEKKGDGPKPKNGQQVKISYEGYFADGTLFDTSNPDLAKEADIYNDKRAAMNQYGPMTTTYGPDAPMISGFKEALQQMQVGDKVVVWIPSELAYGSRGAGGVIPPNTGLVFKMEMLDMPEAQTQDENK